MSARTIAPGFPLLLALVACEIAERSPPATFTVRDSAGVTIVENAAPRWSDGEAPRLAGRPAVTIGVTDGDAPYLFTSILAASRLSDGRLVVVDAGQGEIRTFDARGAYVGTMARRGQGPGEIGRPTGFQRIAGDTLLVQDLSRQAMHVFSGRGEYVESIPYPRVPGGIQTYRLEHRFGDGRLLATRIVPTNAPQPPDGTALVRTLSAEQQLFLVAPGAEASSEAPSVTRIATTRTAPSYEQWAPSGWVFFGPIPHGPEPVRASGTDVVYLGGGETYDIGAYSPEGTLVRRIRLAHTPDPVTAEDVERFRERELDGLEPEIRAERERTFDQIPVPSVKAPFRRLLLDERGRLWIRDDGSEDAPQRWRVFEPDGAYLGDVSMPARLDVLEVGTEYVLARTVDELEVQRIELWEVETVAPSPP